MITTKQPEQFENYTEVVGCFVEYGGKILLLKRHLDKPQGGEYCSPGGKVDVTDDSKEAAIARELFEETGLQFLPEAFKEYITFYVTYEHIQKNFLYHKFILKLDEEPHITLSKGEHTEYLWIDPYHLPEIPFIHDEDTCINYVYKR